MCPSLTFPNATDVLSVVFLAAVSSNGRDIAQLPSPRPHCSGSGAAPSQIPKWTYTRLRAHSRGPQSLREDAHSNPTAETAGCHHEQTHPARTDRAHGSWFDGVPCQAPG